MQHDPDRSLSLILIQITPKERTYLKEVFVQQKLVRLQERQNCFFFDINQVCTTEHYKYLQVQNQNFLAYGIEISFVQPCALLTTDKLAFSSRRIVL